MQHPRRAMLAALSLALFGFVATACGGGTDDPAPPATPPVLTLAGPLDHPASFTLAEVQALPAATQTVSYGSGSGPQTHTYTGASLWSLIDQAGLKLDSSRKNDVLGYYVLATGSDGYKAVFSLGELKPDFGNRASLVVHAETTNGASAPLGSDGPLRITSPGDVKGGRYVSNLTRLDVRAAATAASGVGGGASTQFSVSGAVKNPGSFDLAALQALPAVTQAVGSSSYKGVKLWDFLNTTVGLALDANVKNDVLGKYLVATGSDGYRAVIALGELDPNFGNQPDLIAYELDGAALTTSGFARLVLPNDGKAGRYVSNLISLEVVAAPAAP